MYVSLHDLNLLVFFFKSCKWKIMIEIFFLVNVCIYIVLYSAPPRSMLQCVTHSFIQLATMLVWLLDGFSNLAKDTSTSGQVEVGMDPLIRD